MRMLVFGVVYMYLTVAIFDVLMIALILEEMTRPWRKRRRQLRDWPKARVLR